MHGDKEQAVALLRNIAMSESMEGYHSNLENLKNSEIWIRKSSEPFRNWIEEHGYL